MSIGGDTTELEKLVERFPIKGEVVTTTGFGFGVIIKFKTFYLKLYNDDRRGGYQVEIYHYNSDNVLHELIVPYQHFDEFACQFTKDQYYCTPVRTTWQADAGTVSDDQPDDIDGFQHELIGR